jgi:1,4-dihydroxy-2-naphthoate octaprenyltransferase
MPSVSAWIGAFRLRTLPLASAAVVCGVAIASHPDITITVLILCTAVLLQVLSNLANDYGDFVKGTDNRNRIGNTRALQSGSITQAQMKSMIIVFTTLSLVSGIVLLYVAFQGVFNLTFVLFILLGLAAIAAAIKYTVGTDAYGYRGFGDIAVFLFFGPVAVLGTSYLAGHQPYPPAIDLLPACGMGLLCTAVLNTNNIRDISNDRDSSKRTIPVLIGLRNARTYHGVLIVGGIACFMIYCACLYSSLTAVIPALASVLVVRNLYHVLRTEPSPAFNRFLKELSLGTLLLSLAFAVLLTCVKP